ncbi:MAG: asparaginase [Zoogloeaceae bacterium]|nr:asparaginase [Zoogloeaceae bacterium]
MQKRAGVHLIATGGTIAGLAEEENAPQHYTAGVLPAEQLLASVPGLAGVARLTVEQLYSLDSRDMTPEHWRGLARAVHAALARDDVDGVVVTHGTDTLEESAFYVDLVTQSPKPVVFTGAMRPANAPSPDGPMNLLDAVTVAASPEARGLGVLAVLHQRIHAARDITKAWPDRLDAFSSGDCGVVGRTAPIQIFRAVVPREKALPIAPDGPLPRVDVLVIGAGSAPDMLEAAREKGARAVVLALPGNASLPDAWRDAVIVAAKVGVTTVLAARCGNAVPPKMGKRNLPAIVTALPPAKARVASVAALGAGSDPESWLHA